LFGHFRGHLQDGFDLSHEFVFGFAGVPMAHVQGDLHRALHALLVQRDVVTGEQLLALWEVLQKTDIVFVSLKNLQNPNFYTTLKYTTHKLKSLLSQTIAKRAYLQT